MIIILIVIIFLIIYFSNRKDNEYMNGEYYKSRKVPYYLIKRDLGSYGEYLIYTNLMKYEEMGAKFLFNCYLPNKNGKTSEIDVIMIFRSGIYVFESKNYSGWIWGNSNQNKWTQTLRGGYKEYFYNPISQNKTHIKRLESYLPEVTCAYHSIICFSDRCTFKSLDIKNENVYVIHRAQVKSYVDYIDSKMVPVLSELQIQQIYDKLYPFTQVTQEVKNEHISNINSKNT